MSQCNTNNNSLNYLTVRSLIWKCCLLSLSPSLSCVYSCLANSQWLLEYWEEREREREREREAKSFLQVRTCLELWFWLGLIYCATLHPLYTKRERRKKWMKKCVRERWSLFHSGSSNKNTLCVCVTVEVIISATRVTIYTYFHTISHVTIDTIVLCQIHLTLTSLNKLFPHSLWS